MSVKPTSLFIKSSGTGSESLGKGPDFIETGKHVVRIRLEEPSRVAEHCSVRIAIRNNGEDELPTSMIYKPGDYYQQRGCGDSSASEAADSGTCSDLDGTTPPPNHRRVHSDDDISSPDSLSDTENNDLKQTTNSFLKFHVNEKDFEADINNDEKIYDFAGKKIGHDDTIKSSKGTIRGVKNRVRAGIATFLQINTNRTWQEKEAGKVVVYTTTMGVVRATYQRCVKVRHILRTNMVKFVEKDAFMSRQVQTELKERMSLENIQLPQVFIEGQHIGDADVLEKLNESGELRKMLKPYRSRDACTTCKICGGFRLLPCNICNGSKKSVHRNHFSSELVALKCMHCDEVGLIKCYAC